MGDFKLDPTIDRLSFALNGASMFRLRYKGTVAAGGPRGKAGRQTGWWFKQMEQKAEDQRPFRVKQQMVDGGSCLACINVHPGAQRGKETENKRDCLHFFCRGPQCMHEQCNLFRSHYILLFMISQAEAKIQDYRVSQVVFIVTGGLYGLLFAEASIDLNNQILPALTSHSSFSVGEMKLHGFIIPGLPLSMNYQSLC